MPVVVKKKRERQNLSTRSDTVMGIDPSTKTGIVFLAGDEVLLATTVRFPDADGYERLHMIANSVSSLIDSYRPQAVFIEGLNFRNRFTLVLLSQIGCLIRMALFTRKMRWWDVPPLTLKAWTTGTGKADKQDMVNSTMARWGFYNASDDIVDAYALARLGQFVIAGNTLKGVK